MSCRECGAEASEGQARCARCGVELSEAAVAERLLGRVVGPYRLEELRGGKVFGATEEGTGRWVGVQLESLQPPGSAERERRRRESRRRLRHPNLVGVVGEGEAGDVAYLATDVRPRERPLEEVGPLPRRRALVVAREVARGLEHVHAQGAVHGSLTPAAVLLDSEHDTVRVAWGAGQGEVAGDLRGLQQVLAFALGEEEQPVALPVATAEEAVEELTRLLGEQVPPKRRPTGRLPKRTRRIDLPEYEEQDEDRLDAACLERLPLPLARGLVGAWNARNGLDGGAARGFLLWEGVVQLLAALGAALRREQGEPLPVALQGAPTFAEWLGLARATLEPIPRDDPLGGAARALLFEEQLEGRPLLEYLAGLDARREEAKQGRRLGGEEVTALLVALIELSGRAAFFQGGRLVAIERALWAEGVVTYLPHTLQGLSARQDRQFRGTAGLEAGRLYWRLADEPRFLELDPIWIWHEGEVLLLESAGRGRPRYHAFDGGSPRTIAARSDELESLRAAGPSGDDLGDDSADDVTVDGSSPRASRPQDAQVGRVLAGTYRIAGKIGAGGMGVVYRGWDVRLRREVALKLLTGVQHLDPKTRARFASEARALARLGHPNVVRVYDVGREEDGTEFYAMELLPGPTLAEWIREQAPDAETWERALQASPAQLRQRVRWVRDAARAVHEAHEEGIVHRDLKPANLMLDAQGQVRVLDFGLAHIHGEERTKTSAQLGTPRYMAPEQFTSPKDVDRRADVYALGLCLYALLTLSKPHQEVDEEHAVLARVAAGQLSAARERNPHVPLDLDTVVGKATEQRPADRYGTCNALADDLDRWLDHRPILARPASSLERARKYARREPVKTMALLVLLLALMVLGQAVLRGQSQARAKAGELALEYVRAVESKDPEGTHLFARQLLRLGKGREARVYLLRAAKLGHAHAMHDLAQLLAEGAPDVRDEAEAARWYRQAIDAGEVKAAIGLEKLLRRRPELR